MQWNIYIYIYTHSIVNTYTFDHKIGMPRGQASTMLYFTEGASNNEHEREEAPQRKQEDQEGQKTSEGNNEDNTKELYAASKGKGKGKGKTCWHYGESGHFQRECPHANSQAKDTDIIAALKGKGQGEGRKGKGGKGSYKGGYGKVNNNWYRHREKQLEKGV